MKVDSREKRLWTLAKAVPRVSQGVISTESAGGGAPRILTKGVLFPL